jgi:polysaccharide biosynthesis/export protein
MNKFAFLGFGLCLLAGAAFAADNSAHRLDPSDIITVKVLGQPDLDTQVRVDDDGTINFPFAGRLQVAGKTPDEVGRQLDAALQRANIVNKPQVIVSVMTFGAEVSVLGAVGAPGVFPLDRPLNVTQVLARAGGLKPEAGSVVDLRRQGPNGVQVTHIDIDAALSGQGTQDIQIRNNDEIYVPDAPTYYLYGYVNKPGVYSMKHKMSVNEALAAGGGVMDLGSDDRIRIKHKSASGEVVEVDGSLDTIVEPQDTIIVKERLF